MLNSPGTSRFSCRLFTKYDIISSFTLKPKKSLFIGNLLVLGSEASLGLNGAGNIEGKFHFNDRKWTISQGHTPTSADYQG